MANKQEAEKTEAQLLRVYDFAWNKLQNGARRGEEILPKLGQKMFGEKAGIDISRSGSVEMSFSIMENMLPRVRAFVGSRPRLVNSGDSVDEATDIHWKNKYEGNTCGNKQVHRRRSEAYKVKKIDVIERRTVPIGVMLEDGSSCRRVTGNPKGSSSSYTCQVKTPIVESVPQLTENARKSDQTQQTGGHLSKNLPMSVKESSRQRNSFEAKEVTTCGVVTNNGYCKMIPMAGRKRCEEHKGIKVTGASFVQFSGSSGWPARCGARTSHGSPCKNKPIAGRKRCALHKNRRACCA